MLVSGIIGLNYIGQLIIGQPTTLTIEDVLPNGDSRWLSLLEAPPEGNSFTEVSSRLEFSSWITVEGRRVNRVPIEISPASDITVAAIGVFDAAVGGNLVGWALSRQGVTPLEVSVAAGDTVRVLPYDLALSFTDDFAVLDVTHEDYVGVLQSLLPPGPAWTRRVGARLTQMLQALAREPARVEAQAAQLVEETDYRTAQLLLPEWEAFAGLPGCGAVPTTLAERQAALHAKLTQNISPTPSTFQTIAEGLGYTGVVVARSEADPLVVGFVVGDTLRGGSWHHAWSITTNESTDNDALLQCLVNQLAPRHGTVIFNLGTVGI